MNNKAPEVVYATGDFTTFSDDIVVRLGEGSAKTRRGRMRFCAHQSLDDSLHEMLIALNLHTYIRPHRHARKSESVHVVKGFGDLLRFNDAGLLQEVLRIGPYGSGCCFYYRMAAPQYHMLLVRSDTLVVHETTNGPFCPADTEFAPWAPAEEDIDGRGAFLGRLEKEIAATKT